MKHIIFAKGCLNITVFQVLGIPYIIHQVSLIPYFNFWHQLYLFFSGKMNLLFLIHFRCHKLPLTLIVMWEIWINYLKKVNHKKNMVHKALYINLSRTILHNVGKWQKQDLLQIKSNIIGLSTGRFFGTRFIIAFKPLKHKMLCDYSVRNLLHK